MKDLAGYIISGIVAVIVAIIEAVAQKERKQTKDQLEHMQRNSALRAKESRLSMELMAANAEVNDVLCVALQHGELNGNVEAAQKRCRKALEDYNSFLRDTSAEAVTEG